MKYPTHDEYAESPGYLCWIRDIQNPVRLTAVNKGVSVEELDNLDLASEFHCQVFDLSNAADIEKYRIVSQRILDGWYTLLNIQRHWDDKENTIKVWLEWTQDYLEVTDARQA